jgi:NAD(P)-dependent dehydrogenase (short-subunit alcohol dehydrogenase family)
LLAEDDERTIAYRNGKRWVARLAEAGEIASAKPVFHGGGTWLITGGLRGLGFLTAEWLAERGAKNLALLGRSSPSSMEQDRIAALRAAGVRVELFCADAADEGQLEEAIGQLRRIMPPLTGIAFWRIGLSRNRARPVLRRFSRQKPRAHGISIA